MGGKGVQRTGNNARASASILQRPSTEAQESIAVQRVGRETGKHLESPKEKYQAAMENAKRISQQDTGVKGGPTDRGRPTRRLQPVRGFTFIVSPLLGRSAP